MKPMVTRLNELENYLQSRISGIETLIGSQRRNPSEMATVSTLNARGELAAYQDILKRIQRINSPDENIHDALHFEPRPTMSLVGGIDMRRGGRYLKDEPPIGNLVQFLDDNGYDSDLEEARKHFNKGDILIVEEIFVGGSSSQVEFVSHPGLKFNTVMFEDLEVVR